MRHLLTRTGIAAAVGIGVLGAHALGQPLNTAFTYQGSLSTAGQPASGAYDLRFRLFSALAGGTQVGSTLCADNVQVVDGMFTVSLDFGAQFAGQQRFLEIEVRQDTGLSCANTTGYALLAPRQSLTAGPYSVYALNAGAATTAASATTATNATQLNGQAASFYQNAANLTAGTLPDARLAGTYTGAVTLSNTANTISGSGAGLTGVNAATFNGQTPTAYGRVSAGQSWSGINSFSNVSNTFTGTFTGSGAGVTGVNAAQFGGLLPASFGQLAAAQTWAAANTFSNAGNSFTGNGAGLTGVNAAQLGGDPPGAYGHLGLNQVWTQPNAFIDPGSLFMGDGSGLFGVNADLLGGLPSSAFLQAVPVPLVVSGSDPNGLIQVTSSGSSALNVLASGARGIYAILTGPNPGGVSIQAALPSDATSSATALYASAPAVAYALRTDGRSQFNGDVFATGGSRLGIGLSGVTPPAFPLQFSDALGEKISLFGTTAASHYGLGIQGGTLQLYTDLPASAIAFGSGGSAAFTERVRFSGAADMIFLIGGTDSVTTLRTPYDLNIQRDQDNDSTDAWQRSFTNGGSIEQMRLDDGDEAPASFDGAVNANGIDYAEGFKVLDQTIEPGDLVVVGGEGGWEYASRSRSAYDPKVVGVVSTRPAFVAGMSFDAEDRIDPELTTRRDAARAAGDAALEKELTLQMRALVEQAYRPVAFVGRVPVKVTGPVRVGDHLAASDVPGRAMAMGRAGQSVGVALEASDGPEGTVMVMIQPKYFVPAGASGDGNLADQFQALADENQRMRAENEDLRLRIERLERRLNGP